MPLLYLDIETDNTNGSGLDVFSSKVVTIQILLPSGETIILKDPKSLDNVKSLLENNLIIGHNLKFDSKFLKYHFGVTLSHVYDTYIAEIVLSGGQYANDSYRRIYHTGLALKDLVFRYCGAQMDKEEQTGFRYGVPLTEQQKQYAANDLKYLPKIFKQQLSKIKLLGLENTIDIEMKTLPAVVWLELSGFKVDPTKIKEVDGIINNIISEAESSLFPRLQPIYQELFPKSKAQINLNSTQQLLPTLQAMGFNLTKTDEDSLAEYAGNEVIDVLLKYRFARKFLTTYIAPAYKKTDSKGGVIKGYIHEDGRTYTNFNQYGTETGRLSCSKNNLKKLPIQCLNLQTQPTKLGWRDVFVAEEGCQLIVADYSQIEPRIMAQVSHDDKMIEAYKSGKDLYKLTASAIFGIPYEQVVKESREREISKQVTLGLCYGMGPQGLISKLKTDSNGKINLTKAEAETYIRKFERAYPQVNSFLNSTAKGAVKNKMVRNASGRIRKFNPPSNSKERFGIERQGKNAVIQSLSADMTKIAMGNLFLRLEPMGVKFVNTVHDELVFEAQNEISETIAKIVEDEMIKAGKMFLPDIPCEASITVSPKWKK